MLDSTKYNNIYQYESQVGYFGYQKFYNTAYSGLNNEMQNACYWLLTSAKIK